MRTFWADRIRESVATPAVQAKELKEKIKEEFKKNPLSRGVVTERALALAITIQVL